MKGVSNVMRIGSQYAKSLSEASVSDGKGGQAVVKGGDKLDLLPVEARTFDGDESQKEDKRYLAERNFERHRRWLGNGPFTVQSITRWPCGTVMIYIHCSNSDGAGVYASDMMALTDAPAVPAAAAAPNSPDEA